MSWPTEPEAMPTPKASERLSGVTLRPNVATTIEKEAKATPTPTVTPAVTCIMIGAVEWGIRAMPAA